ncbi:hypothetical protein PGUG_05852 [Meyerozyma guilliermondii ATCC 6260]|uniref:Conserved oligomeric Golgi complex subunit 3 n=1 Tax=Meyerozyma guilliermondii (strain ATCC 6260 / CBS 566 / DSM 6381 / JCM 1539 / NBRC 10279 / NRRL Y-324) TaxID=294746 RepID=A5DRF1_PICGU|nr:uncharacterized protein PGUG_05852 [Meyerozyma guilliermondii ATCC 6260]EDK41754.2 hypothetical protein PGUG_05852 [Meyerozyma guilliermondii ATCC 6260]
MGRDRSKSLVKRIASDIPSFNDGKLDLGSISSLAPPSVSSSRPRSKSVDDVKLKNNQNNEKNKIGTAERRDHVLYPFSSAEYNQLWSGYIDTYTYNSILTNEDIENIGQLPIDSALNFQHNCQLNSEAIEDLIRDTDAILAVLDRLVDQYNKVDRDTSDFAKQSQRLLEEQKRAEETSSEISEALSVFEASEWITKVLSSPGINLVKKRSFKEAMAKLDSCIEFVDTHPNYKDIDTYRARFRQCMTRALTLIRNYLIEDIKSTAALSESTKTETSSMEVTVYSDFKNHANRHNGEFYSFHNLIVEIEKRYKTHPEYEGLLSDVSSQYFRVRSNLVASYINQNVETLSKKYTGEKDLVQLCQNNISFFKRVIEREHGLFCQYFSGSASSPVAHHYEGQLYEWYKDLLEPLYDTLRDRIIRAVSISELCSLMTLLQKYYEFEDPEGSMGGSVVGSVVGSTVGSISSDVPIDYGQLFEPIVADVQSRLIFRVQRFVDDNIINYKPRPKDLQIGSTKVNVTHQDDEVNLFPQMYLPVGKALTVLSSIYDLINSAVFDDLAHYIVHSCIQILQTSGYKLAESHLGSLDAKLYYLKNLMLVQHQLNNFDIQHVRTETALDFTSGLSEILNQVRHGDFMVNYTKSGGFIELARRSAPRVVNNMIDAKYEIDSELNNAVQDFIGQCVKQISKPILAQDAVKTPLKATSDFRDLLLTEIPRYYRDIQLSFSDSNVTKYLMENMESVLLTTYTEYYHRLEQIVTSADLDASASDKLRSDMTEVMEPDTLVGFLTDLVANLYDKESESGQVDEKLLEQIENDLNIEEGNE